MCYSYLEKLADTPTCLRPKTKKSFALALFGVSCDGGVSLVLDSPFCLNPEMEDSILSS